MRNNSNRIAEALTLGMQSLIDERILLSDLPDDDPDKRVDPTSFMGERMFWQNISGQDYLVSRSVVVTITWNGAEYIQSVRRAR